MGAVTVMCAPAYVVAGKTEEAGGCGYRWRTEWEALAKAGIACTNCGRKIARKVLTDTTAGRTEPQLAPRLVVLDDGKSNTVRGKRKTVFRIDFDVPHAP